MRSRIIIPTDKTKEVAQMGMIERAMEWNRLESRPVPLNMTDKEILDWLDEMQPKVDWEKGNANQISGVFLDVPEIGRTFAKTLREAVCRAEAKWKEVNS
jgi:hypothetical protein